VTRNEFMSAISQLAVPPRPRPDDLRAAHPRAQLYLAAGGAFNRTGAASWLWFMKRGDEAVADDLARSQFIAWLKGATETEIGRFIRASEAYRQKFSLAAREYGEIYRRELVADGEEAPEGVLKGAAGRIAWRAAERWAGDKATRGEQKSTAGIASGKARGDPFKTEVLRLAEVEMSKPVKPRSRRHLAGKILNQLGKDFDRSQDRIERILKEKRILEPKKSFGVNAVRAEKQG
jgi:hypothetical protein